jgi:acetolactate synthase I/II/III large subunit
VTHELPTVCGNGFTGKQTFMSLGYTVGDLVAEFLQRCGVRAAFGIASVHNIPMLDAISRRNEIRFVMTRGEMGAAHMADAYARAGGGLGIVITSTGPGASNAATGLLEAQCAGTPVLHLTGNVPMKHRDMRRGATHDVPNQLGMLEAVSKAAYCIRSPQEAFGILVRAVSEALTAPQGPVSVEIPIDIQKSVVTRSAGLDSFALPIVASPAPGAAALDALAERVLRARRPMLWTGSGARFAGAVVQKFLDLGFGLVTSWNGRGVVSEDHPLNLGTLHGVGMPLIETFYESVDLLIVAGSRLRGQETLDASLKLPQSKVQIDLDPTAEGRTYATEAFVCGDAQLALQGLLERIEGRMRIDAAFAAQFRKLKQEARAAFKETLGPYSSFADQLRSVTPRDAVWVRDITVSNSTWGHRLFALHAPRDNVYPTSAGIGQGLPLAVGAAIAAGRRKTVLLSGDGGFVLNLGELWTVAQERPNLLMIVMNDRGYAVIKHMQDAQFNGNRQYGDLLGPDFGGLARLAGLPFRKVERAEDFGVTAARAMEINGPAMIEVDMSLVGAHPPYFPYSALPQAPERKA